MSTTKPKPIAPFKSLDEEAEFWETHDLAELFVNPKIDLKDLPKIEDWESDKEVTLTIRLQKSLKQTLKKIAKAKGLNTSTLSRMWLMEKISNLQKNSK